jgi:hypothetical protein
MKYIDGIKTPILLIPKVKHIPITYYKPLIICDDHLSICKGELKWVDGQPYELIIIGKD